MTQTTTKKDPAQEQLERLREVYASFHEKPTKYSIDVLDNSMLPANLRDRKQIHFIVKPPTFEILMAVGELMLEVPKEMLTKTEDAIISDLVPVIPVICRVFARMAHGRLDDYPDWYEPFIRANCTPMELWLILKDLNEKSATAFFLSSLKMTAVGNPMSMLNEKEIKDLTRTPSPGK